jgi:hypothetical protein
MKAAPAPKVKHRPKNEDAHLPLYRAWLKDLNVALDERGASAELSRWLAACYSLKPRPVTTRVARIRSGEVVAGGEYVLAISQWLKNRSRKNRE